MNVPATGWLSNSFLATKAGVPGSTAAMMTASM
jgi:hypothetical protein